MSVGVRAGMRAVMPRNRRETLGTRLPASGRCPERRAVAGETSPFRYRRPKISHRPRLRPRVPREARRRRSTQRRSCRREEPTSWFREQRGEERLAKTASDATELTASTENAEDVDVIDDKDVEEGKVKAETSREGPAGGDANAGHEGDGNSVQVNTDTDDRSSFGGSVSKTPIRPHASGGLGRVVTRSSSPPLSSSSRKRRTAALAAVRAAARTASTASSLDGSNSGEPATDATDEDDSEVTGPSEPKEGDVRDENIREHSRTIANDENAAPRVPRDPGSRAVKDADDERPRPTPPPSI